MNERVSKLTNEWKSKWVNEWKSEWVSEEVSEWVSMWISDEIFTKPGRHFVTHIRKASINIHMTIKTPPVYNNKNMSLTEQLLKIPVKGWHKLLSQI